MTYSEAIKTQWTDRLRANGAPEPASVKNHLIEVHRRNPGFTESCASKCVDAEGRTSYEWLADVIAPQQHLNIMDMACGSGVLLAELRNRHPNANLTGVDMSRAELNLALDRLRTKNVNLHEGMAQDLSFASAGQFDAVLCHWALTLMDPVEPVLHEVLRVLAPGGVFAAIIDGELTAAPHYNKINDLVFDYVKQELPSYGDHDLGDPRIREPEKAAALCRSVFPSASVRIESTTVALQGEAQSVAAEAVGFFYAAFILPKPTRERLIAEAASLISHGESSRSGTFSMPICRLEVRQP